MTLNGLIYKVQDYQESSKLLYVYTKEGKFTLVAKGSKKYQNPNHHLAEYLMMISSDIKLDKPMQTLKNASLISDYPHLKGSYETLKKTAIILRAIDLLLTPDLPHERLFNLIEGLLNRADPHLSALTFMIKLTYALGYELTFTTDKPVGFSLQLGRTVSQEEAHLKTLDLLEATYLQKLYYLKDEDIEIPKEVLHTLTTFIKTYYMYHMDYKISF